MAMVDVNRHQSGIAADSIGEVSGYVIVYCTWIVYVPAVQNWGLAPGNHESKSTVLRRLKRLGGSRICQGFWANQIEEDLTTWCEVVHTSPGINRDKAIIPPYEKRKGGRLSRNGLENANEVQRMEVPRM